jgi:hypothetical protein
MERGLSGGLVAARPACPPLGLHGDLPVVKCGQCFASPVDPVLDLGPCLGDRAVPRGRRRWKRGVARYDVGRRRVPCGRRVADEVVDRGPEVCLAFGRREGNEQRFKTLKSIY